MATNPRWMFTKEQLVDTPSRKYMNEQTELETRQLAAMFIQDTAQALEMYPFFLLDNFS